MKRISAFGALFVLLVLSLPAARAATPPGTTTGGCYYETVGPTRDLLAAGVRSVTTTSGGTPYPVSATVSCYLRVNGSAAPGIQWSASDLGSVVTGVQVGSFSGPTASLQEGDVLELCQRTEYHSLAQVDPWSCWALPPLLGGSRS